MIRPSLYVARWFVRIGDKVSYHSRNQKHVRISQPDCRRTLFETDRRQYWDYRQFGLQGEEFATKGPEGTSISGLWLKALPQDGKTLQGTVLYAHNCTRNYGYHLPQVSWLVPAGWNVVLYDPEETGRSTGKLTLNGMVDDAEAVYQYVRGQRGVSAKNLSSSGRDREANLCFVFSTATRMARQPSFLKL